MAAGLLRPLTARRYVRRIVSGVSSRRLAILAISAAGRSNPACLSNPSTDFADGCAPERRAARALARRSFTFVAARPGRGALTASGQVDISGIGVVPPRPGRGGRAGPFHAPPRVRFSFMACQRSRPGQPAATHSVSPPGPLERHSVRRPRRTGIGTRPAEANCSQSVRPIPQSLAASLASTRSGGAAGGHRAGTGSVMARPRGFLVLHLDPKPL
jgi:hypothetical protein